MSTTTCSNCGKPLRPGARFCGHCGTPAPLEQPVPVAAQPEPGGQVCPHCGKPVRAGAKFCNSCGKAIRVEEVPPTEPSEPAPALETPRQVTPSHQAATPVAKVSPKDRKRWWLPALITFLILCLILGAGGSYVYFVDPLGWVRTHTPTLTREVTASAETPTATQTSTTASNTQAPVVVETSTPQETKPSQETPAPPPTQEPQWIVIFEENFETALTLNWHLWGSPVPKLRTGFESQYMEVMSEEPASSGASTKQLIELSQGTVVEFRARLPENAPQSVLVFQWNPGNQKSQPVDRPGVLHLEIHRDMVALVTPMTESRCELNLDAMVVHTYRLSFLEGGAVELIVDDTPSISCRIDTIGISPFGGRISFSGQGWVSSVKVMLKQ